MTAPQATAEDLLDLAVIEKRRNEKPRPFADYVVDRAAKK